MKKKKVRRTKRPVSATKDATIGLQHSEEIYRTLVENIGLGIGLIDTNYRIIMTNVGQARLIKKSRSKLLGNYCFKEFEKRDAVCSHCPGTRAIATGRPAEIETEGVSDDGSRRPVRVRAFPVYKADGTVKGFVEVVEDITERKKVEEALTQSEEKYRSVIENIGIGVALISPKMEILALNRQMREWFPQVDVSKQPICYKTFNRPARNDVCSYCPTCKSLKDGQVHEAITETPAGDKIINYRIISSPIKDQNNKIIAAIEMVEDITEQRKIEQALRESQEIYKTLFEGAAEGILVADIKTKRFKYANPAVCRMLGYTGEELKRLGASDIHPKEELQHVISEFEAMALGEKILAEAIPCLRKDGTVLYSDISAARVLIEGTQCDVGFFTDITERKRAQEELEKARDRLEFRVQERTAELEKAVAKLRNEVSERKKAEEKLLTYQKRLRSSASELSLAEERLRRKIATDVHDHLGQNLALSKLKIESLAHSAASPQLIEELKEIRDLIAQAVESTRSLTFELSPPILYELGFGPAVEWLLRQIRQQHGLSTEFTDDELPKPLDDDIRVLLFQAVRELLVNVVKHAKAGSVKVSTQRVDDQIQISVEDDGVGFDVRRLYSQDRMGGGFGLFNIRERLDHIGGHLDITSRTGKGTCVTLLAPITHKKEKSKEKRK
jgi:PAS domain S-box-containing protein